MCGESNTTNASAFGVLPVDFVGYMSSSMGERLYITYSRYAFAKVKRFVNVLSSSVDFLFSSLGKFLQIVLP